MARVRLRITGRSLYEPLKVTLVFVGFEAKTATEWDGQNSWAALKVFSRSTTDACQGEPLTSEDADEEGWETMSFSEDKEHMATPGM